MVQCTQRWTRVLVVDDHPAIREALGSYASRDCDLEICGEAADAAEALRLLDSTRPDVAVVDIALKAGDGIELIKRIRSHCDSVRIVVWSMYPERRFAVRALRAGALGYVNKQEPTDVVVEAIRRVRDGKVFLKDSVAAELLQQAFGGGGTAVSPVGMLSDRELEVFRLIGEGLMTCEIAERMRVSTNTVESYRQRIKTKLSLKSAAELARAATEWALEPAGDPQA